MRILEKEEREKGTEEIFKTIMTENFPKLMSDTKPQIQEAQRTLSRRNAKKLHNMSFLKYRKSKIRNLLLSKKIMVVKVL